MKLTATLADLLRDLPKILAAGVEVTEVEVSDKKPDPWPTDDGAEFYLEENWWDDQPHGIPPWIWDCMDNPKNTDNLIYKAEAEARKALSDAILAWAKQQNQ